MLKPLLTISLSITLLAQSALPTVVFAQSAERRTRTRANPSVMAKIPAFPEVQMEEPDWSEVNWEREIILPKDHEAFMKELEKLDESKNREKIEALEQSLKKSFSDDAVMAEMGVPQYVREMVKEYYPEKSPQKKKPDGAEGIGADSLELSPLEPQKISDKEKKDLQQQIRSAQVRKKLEKGDLSFSTETPPENTIDAQSLEQQVDLQDFSPLQKPNKHREAAEPVGKIRVQSKAVRAPKKLKTLQEIQNIPLKTPEEARTSWTDTFFGHLFFKANAQEVLPNLIESYEGIEHHPIDSLLLQLMERQNPDGSFGTDMVYELSANIAFILSDFNRTENETYQRLMGYLQSAPAKNLREKAMKARILISLSLPHGDLMTEIAASQNPNGGFGLDTYYFSDVLTTLEVLLTLLSKNAHEYPDSIVINNQMLNALVTILREVEQDGSMRYRAHGEVSYYLMNRTLEVLQPFSPFELEVNGTMVSVQSTIDTLLQKLAASYDEVNQVLAGGNKSVDLLMTLENFQRYQVFPEKQATLKAQVNGRYLSSSIELGHQFEMIAAMRALAQPDVVITSITPTSSLINDEMANFAVVVKNIGYKPTNQLHLYEFIDRFLVRNGGLNLTQAGVVLQPNQEWTVNVAYNLASPLAETPFDFYVEADQEHTYKNNWRSETFHYDPASDGSPALQSYFIATKYETGGVAGLNVRWQVQEDPRRKNYAILFREKGTAQWSASGISNDWNGAFIIGLQDGTEYEVTVGVVSTNDEFYWYDTPVLISAGIDETLDTGSINGTVNMDGEPLEGAFLFGYGITARSDSEGTFSDGEIQHGTNGIWVSEDHLEDFRQVFPIPKNGVTDGIIVLTKLKADTENPQLDVAEIRFAPNFIVRNQRTVELLAYGSDNIGFSNADFYYWNPIEQFWNYIGNTSQACGDCFLYEWYIPQELLGPGYKIKSVVYDYQNNLAEKEWGPFEIVDGAIPSGSVQVLGLQNGEWGLGENFTVEWNIGSNNALSYQHITLRYGSNSNRLKSNYDLSQNSFSYTMPLATVYTTPLNEASIMIEACDVFNSCTEVESDPFTIVDRTPPPQTPWQPDLQEVSGIITGYPVYRTIYSFHHNPDNTLDVVYVESDYSSYDQTTHKLYARKFTNNQWQTPVLIRESMYEYGDTQYFIFDSIQSVHANNGDLHVIYNEYDQRASYYFNTNEVHYAHVSNGVLVSSRQVTNSAIASFQPALQVSGNGKVALLWRSGIDFSTNTGQGVLYLSEGDGLNSWSAPAQFSPGPGRTPAMQYNSEQLYVVYNNEDQYLLIRRSSGVNSPALVVVNRQVPRSQLDAFTADQPLFDSIVVPDPENPSNYLWKEGIRTKSDLESILNTQGFTETQGILAVWGKYQFGRSAYSIKLFSSGGNFDLFAQKQDVDVSVFQFNLQHLRFSPNFSTQSIDVSQHQLIFDLIPENQVQGFAVAQRPDQNTYHLFYILAEPNDNNTIYRPYHTFYDGERTHFTANIASSLLNVSNSYSISTSNINDGIRAYFYSYLGGLEKLVYNSADYSSIIENRFIPIRPEPSKVSSGTNVIFEWQHSGEVADSYELWLGKDRHNLNQAQAGLQQMSATLMGLDPDATYSWKVVANLGSQKVHSDVWRFKTPSDLPPQFSVSYNETELSHEENFSLGTIQVGNPGSFTFEIKNMGGGTLQLDDLLPVEIQQDEQEVFSLSSPPTSLDLSSGETSSFEMQIDPLSEGTFNATLILKSNDLVNPEFSIDLSVFVQQRTTGSIAGPSDLKHFDASGQVELPMGTLFEETQPTLAFTIRDASETTPYSYIIQVDDDGNFTDGPNSNEGDVHNFTLPATTQEGPEVQYLLPNPLPDGYYYWRARVKNDQESQSLWTYANNGNRAFVLQKSYEFLFNGSIEESQHGGRDITVSGSGLAYQPSYDQIPDNKAAFFDGKDDQILLNHDVPGGDLTFSAWVYPTQNGLKKPLIDRKRYRVEIDENEAIAWSIHDEATDAAVSLQSPSLSPGWHHLVATVKSGEYLRLYVDGALVGEQIGNWNIRTQDFFDSEKLTLGGKNSEWYQGGVDDLKIWKKALTENEMASLYTPLPEPSGEESLLFSASQLSFSDTIFGEQSSKSLTIQSANSQTPVISHLISSCPVYSIQGWLAPQINQNTNFDTSVDAWEKWPNEENNDQGRSSQLIITQDQSTFAAGGGSAKVEIQYHSDETWEAQLYQNPISVALQEHYQLSFFAKGDQARSIQAGIHESLQPSSGSIGDLHTLQLTTEWQYFNLPITITKQDEQARLQFSLGGTIGSVWLDEVKLQKTTQNLLLDSPQTITVNFAPLKVKTYQCKLTVKTLSGKTHTIPLSGVGSDMIFRREDPLLTPLPLELFLPASSDSFQIDDSSPLEESSETPETPQPPENPENP